jgi:Flp pilus assembly protein TadG
MQPLKWLRKLSRSERGNALVVCAATLPLVIGSAAIGVDTIQVSLARRQLQRAADSAAIAGALAKHAEQNVATAANHDLSLNNDVTLSTAAVIENAPTVGAYAGNQQAVRVVLTATRSVPFMSFFTGSNMTVTTEATATSIFQGEYCMVSLERANVSGAIAIGGSATVNLGCGMISNSSSNTAVTAGGSSTITASPVAAVGGVPASSSYASGTVRLPFSPAQADPYAGLPNPTVPGGCSSQPLRAQPQDNFTISGSTNAQGGQVSPGVYCYNGMDIKGTVTLPPNSIIYLNGGNFDIGAQAHLTGEHVTFILTSSTAATDPGSIAQLSINGGAELDLTASSTGTYEGVLFYQDRRAPYGSSQINGNSLSMLRGGIYFPNRQLVFNGTAGMSTECIQLVGRRLAFSGNASVNNSCPAGEGAEAFQATFVRLVG